MTRRCDRKPKDPNCRVYLPRGVARRVADMLRSAYGPSLPLDLSIVVTALEEGITRYKLSPNSLFSGLLDERELTVETTDRVRSRRVKSAAHQWARYHGHQVATRSHPHGTAITVYLVKRAGA